MSRAAIVATIVTSTLAFSSPALAASDEELARSGDLMRAAFRCLTYARMFHDNKEEQRLIEIGLKAGHDFVEGAKSSDPKFRELWGQFSTDFIVGGIYESETTNAYDEIVKYDDGQPREKALDPSEAKVEAERSYRESNCSLIQ